MHQDALLADAPPGLFQSLDGTYLMAVQTMQEALTLPTDFPDFTADPHTQIDAGTGAFVSNQLTSDVPDTVGALTPTLEKVSVEPLAHPQPGAESPTTALKRQRNALAARKHRQKRLDRIKELETALDAMTHERDDLRLRLARQEAETAALREMLSLKS